MRTKERISHLSSPLTSSALKGLTDLEVWQEYNQYRDTHEGRAALSELLDRYRPMLNSVAAKVAFNNKQLADIADFNQDAVFGAILAFRRFKPEKAVENGSLLYTFVRRTVSMHLLTRCDEVAFVNCPSHMRQMRGYFMGRMDRRPEVKEAFEKAKGLTSPQRLEIEADKTRGLILNYEPIEGSGVPGSIDRSCPTEEDLVTRIELELRKANLTERQQATYEKIYEEQLSIPETAAELGLTVGQVRGDLFLIRKTLSGE